jgi:hypothetical protein
VCGPIDESRIQKATLVMGGIQGIQGWEAFKELFAVGMLTILIIGIGVWACSVGPLQKDTVRLPICCGYSSA